MIRPLDAADLSAWIDMRARLWPEESRESLEKDARESQAALGFSEVEVLVVFRKALG